MLRNLKDSMQPHNDGLVTWKQTRRQLFGGQGDWEISITFMYEVSGQLSSANDRLVSTPFGMESAEASQLFVYLY